MGSEDVDYSKIPLCILSDTTRDILFAGLNQCKIIPNEEGIPRDWRGLAHMIGLNGVEISRMKSQCDPSDALFKHWGENGNVLVLKQYLKDIDRYDILDDVEALLERDCNDYLERLKKIGIPTDAISLDADKMILTTDDLIRLEKGLKPQLYDAYLLYAPEDSDFAADVVEKMESKYGLKICVRDRDLIGGIQFEHDAVRKLISERCRRMVVIVSPNFLQSNANKFFVAFAQALSIDIRERKVIPILYKKCVVPPELSYYFMLDYNRVARFWNFWDKLRDSIQGPELRDKRAIANTTSVPTEDSVHESWTSKTHFEAWSVEKPELNTCSTVESEPVKVQTKERSRVYKLIKNTFGKARKLSDQEFDNAKTKKSSSLLANLSLVSGDKDSFQPSTAFEVTEDNGEKKFGKKKKWLKGKSLETLVS